MAQGTATLAFGGTPTDTATLLVSGLSGLSAASFIEAFFMKESTASNGVDDHEMAASLCRLVCEFVSASSFNIIAECMDGMLAQDDFLVRWVTA